MNLADELQKLAELHRQGLLTEQEFAAAKRRLLAAAPEPAQALAPARKRTPISSRVFKQLGVAIAIIGLSGLFGAGAGWFTRRGSLLLQTSRSAAINVRIDGKLVSDLCSDPTFPYTVLLSSGPHVITAEVNSRPVRLLAEQLATVIPGTAVECTLEFHEDAAQRAAYDAEQAKLQNKLAEERRVREEAIAKAIREKADAKRQESEKRDAERKAAVEKMGKREINDLKIVLIPIVVGSFTMGSTSSEADEWEKPLTQVTLTKPYWLGETEVTQGQWEAVMGNNPSHFKGADLPVEGVSYDDALAFCRKLNVRERAAGRLQEGYVYTLPTEAQWEYACRAGTTGDYAGDLDKLVWYTKNSGSTTHPVGTKQANAWGLYDMQGNVSEWCSDWFDSYHGGSVTDYAGPLWGIRRVFRGGSWVNWARDCRSSARSSSAPDLRGDDLGFRLCLSAIK